MQRRRNSRRIPSSLINVSLLVDGYMTAHGELTDLSLQGAGLWTVVGFRIGDILDLRLESGEDLGSFFRSTVRVVWSRTAKSAHDRMRCGVCWAHLVAAERRSLGRFMAATCTER
ncbi:MAG: PilZ domain-containing protein [Vicinamibacteria bacterium]|nr:PilZ domain-containing protein [Vicinamibacteria bacterium]